MIAERRRYLRHKVHSPAYASVGAGVGGVVLDANEGGAAVETVARLAPQAMVDLRLDLLETRSTAVTPARVAWCDEGRAGLEFLNLTGESRRQLQQWLLLNTLLASERGSQLAQRTPRATGAEATEGEGAADPRFRLMVEQALAVTGAQGAALALADGAEIVCRAVAGEIAPPPGTRLDAAAGISGACVREGRCLRCDDPDLDPHVDRESCRALGINSVMAVPIGEQGNILGLIEVFSRQTYAFHQGHCSALQALAEGVGQRLQPQPAKETAPVIAVATSAEAVNEAQPAAEAAPLSAPPEAAPEVATVPTAPVAAEEPASDAPVFTADPQPEAALGMSAVQKTVLLCFLAGLVIAGLWLVLTKDIGEATKVDAAETTSAASQNTRLSATPVSNQNSNEFADAPVPIRELQQRAQAGDADAQFELGAKYATGEETPQDYGEAVKWFTRAAEGGQVLAAATLGAYYWAGRGVPQDDISAYMWSAIARQEGDEASKYRMAILRAHMNEGQIAEAEQRVAKWLQARARQPLSISRTAGQ